MVNSPGPGHIALRKGRFSQEQGIYFITSNTYQRIPLFRDWSVARTMCRMMEDETFLSSANNLCWVVMPDHLHMLLQLSATSLSQVIKRFKARSAHKLNRVLHRNGPVWSPGFYDHALRKEEDILGVARYIVANPLRAGLVSRITDYPYWNATWL